MKKILKKFTPDGTSIVNIDKAILAWNDTFIISQFRNDYSLMKSGRGGNYTRVKISKEQAIELIDKLKLKQIQSSTFKSGKTYITESLLVSELKRFFELKNKITLDIEKLNSVKESKLQEINALNESIYEYSTAV